MEQKNRINKTEKSAATDFKVGSSSATNLRNTIPINKSGLDSNTALKNPGAGYINTYHRSVGVPPEYDFSARRAEATSIARIKIEQLEDEIRLIKSTGENKDKLKKLETSLEHQRRILEHNDRYTVNGVKDTIASMRYYIDKNEQVKDYQKISSTHKELSGVYARNAQYYQNKAHTATNSYEASKYQSKAEKALKRSQNESERASKWESKVEKAKNREQTSVGRAREKIREFQNNNFINRSYQNLSNGVKNALKSLGNNLTGGIKSLFSSSAGRWGMATVVVLSLCLSQVSDFTYYVHAEEVNRTDETYIEYSVWLEKYNDEGEKFYDDYHAIVPSAYLVPISYTYKNQGIYQKYLNEWFEAIPFNKTSGDRAEYLKNAYEYAVDSYFGNDFDPYQLRELFLDKVEYQYQYLAREYSEWIYDLENPEGYAEMQSYEKEIVVEDWDYVEHSHQMSAEECRNSNFRPSDVNTCIANPPTIVDGTTYEKVGEHTEMKTFYRGRNITNEYWELDVNGDNIDHDIHRTVVDDGYSQVVIPDLPTYQNGGYSPDYSDNIGDHDSYWIYMYAENGTYVKRIRYWLLRDNASVYEDIAFNYFPENEDDEILKLSKEDPVNGEVTFEVERKNIYNVYFADDQTGIYRENYFLDEYNYESNEQMSLLYKAFVEMFSVNGIQFGEGKILVSPFKTAGLDAQSQITQHFAQIGVGNKGQQHGAVDFAFPSGTSINAMIGGTVVSIRENVPENTSKHCAVSPESAGCHGNIGNEVLIETKIAGVDGNEHTIKLLYYHILGGSASKNGIKVGDVVSSEQIIAEVGHNGLSTGAHLHLAMYIDGERVDVEQYIQF
ncbi:MAG: M23 family metallopeptidase [Erysipelotrichaceae bacterium]|nr:M23 family metallopeptidase [Erysipelotrichaceae bacterium]